MGPVFWIPQNQGMLLNFFILEKTDQANRDAGAKRNNTCHGVRKGGNLPKQAGLDARGSRWCSIFGTKKNDLLRLGNPYNTFYNLLRLLFAQCFPVSHFCLMCCCLRYFYQEGRPASNRIHILATDRSLPLSSKPIKIVPIWKSEIPNRWILKQVRGDTPCLRAWFGMATWESANMR